MVSNMIKVAIKGRLALVLAALIGICLFNEAKGRTAIRCGVRTEEFVFHGRVSYIIGGVEANIEQYPWLVSIEDSAYSPTGDLEHVCGGALIRPDVVLTASHCLYNRQPGTMKIVAGVTDLARPGPDLDVVPAAKLLVHPNYDDDLFDYDIGLIKLSRPVKLDGVTKGLVCLSTSEADIPPVGRMAELAGYGKTEHGLVTRLQSTLVPIRSVQDCYRYYDNRVSPRNDLCAGNSTVGGCRGDSGGPLVARVGGKDGPFKIIGVVNFGPEGCQNADFPTTFARVYKYNDWIMRNINAMKGQY